MARRLIVACTLAALAVGVAAQTYPTKPIRMLVGYATGGGMDAITRIAATKLADVIGQPVLVENRAGALATIAADAVVKSPADGYTLHMAETGLLVAPVIYPKLAFDPLKSFTPIAAVASLPLAIVVNPALPATTIEELSIWLKSNPGKASYGSPGVGSLQHLAMELFRKTIGAEAIHIPYRGAGPMMPDLIGGELPLAVISVAPALAQARSGKLRTIAVTSAARLPQAPTWPTLAESVAGFDAAPRVFLLAPAGLPAAIVARLAEAMRQALAAPDVLEALAKQGATAQWSSDGDLAAAMAADARKWGGVAREAGVRAE